MFKLILPASPRAGCGSHPDPGGVRPLPPYGAVDVDGDGLVDLLQTHHEQLLRRATNDGFGSPEALPIDDGGMPWGLQPAMIAADPDADGLLDLVIGEMNCVANTFTWSVMGSHQVVRALRDPAVGLLRVSYLQTYRNPDGTVVMMPQGSNCDRSIPAHPGFLRQVGLDDDRCLGSMGPHRSRRLLAPRPDHRRWAIFPRDAHGLGVWRPQRRRPLRPHPVLSWTTWSSLTASLTVRS